jgi:hypothetical protein
MHPIFVLKNGCDIVCQSDHEIGSTIPSGGAVLKIMMMV